MHSIVRLGFGAAFATLMACGGAVSSDDGGTNDDGGPGSDSSKQDQSNPPNGCPVAPPTGGASCAQDQLKCEYGTNPDPNCNQQFFCNAGHWQDQSSGTICAPQSDCPATYASVPANQDCTPNMLICAYPQGQCICTTSFGGVQKQTPAWQCAPAVSGCPSPRPDIGTACTGTQQCDYGGCSGGVALECKDSEWTQVFTPCPG